MTYLISGGKKEGDQGGDKLRRVKLQISVQNENWSYENSTILKMSEKDSSLARIGVLKVRKGRVDVFEELKDASETSKYKSRAVYYSSDEVPTVG